MKIALSTESSSDLPRELAERFNIHVIAFTVDSFKLIDYEYEPLDKKFEVAI